MDEILYALCRHNVSILDSGHPYPATVIARALDMNKNVCSRNISHCKS